MWVCVCVCVCVCFNVFVCICIFRVYVCACVKYIKFLFSPQLVLKYDPVNIVCVHTHIDISTLIDTHTHTHTHTNIYTHFRVNYANLMWIRKLLSSYYICFYVNRWCIYDCACVCVRDCSQTLPFIHVVLFIGVEDLFFMWNWDLFRSCLYFSMKSFSLIRSNE